jgi:WhiB family redox-sensing transcriptional regulator
MERHYQTREPADRAFMVWARCRTVKVDMHPIGGAGVIVAKRVCKDCPVRGECLEYALTTRQYHGVWGGCSERERRVILKRRRERTAA